MMARCGVSLFPTPCANFAPGGRIAGGFFFPPKSTTGSNTNDAQDRPQLARPCRDANAVNASAAQLAAVAEGKLTPAEASELAKLIDTCVRSIEATEFEERCPSSNRINNDEPYHEIEACQDQGFRPAAVAPKFLVSGYPVTGELTRRPWYTGEN
jgi:hypothetical protein